MNRILLPLLLTLTLSACSSSGPVATIEDHGQASKPAAASTAAPDQGASATGLPPGAGVEGKALEGGKNADPRKDPASPLSKRSIYFDYDSNVVKADYQAVIEAHAGYLLAHKDAKLALQGNTDERGSREYNLALGQRRAEAVRKALSVLGVGDAQMEAVSFGEEKPKATGHDEAAWAENRRVDLVYSDE